MVASVHHNMKSVSGFPASEAQSLMPPAAGGMHLPSLSRH